MTAALSDEGEDELAEPTDRSRKSERGAIGGETAEGPLTCDDSPAGTRPRNASGPRMTKAGRMPVEETTEGGRV